jgi:hypothetical protein
MANAVSRKDILDTCEKAIFVAEKTYRAWTPSEFSMRAAPESFVQMIIAGELSKLDKKTGGVKLLLEASVAELLKKPEDKKSSRSIRTGRIDIVVYYKSMPQRPRLLIEVKKITRPSSFNEDLKRILELMDRCEEIQNGVLIGYGTRVKKDKLTELFENTKRELKKELQGSYKGYRLVGVREAEFPVVNTRAGERTFNAMIFKVSRPKVSRGS